MDLWVTTRPTKNDSWGEPVNLGPMVNSKADDISARLAPDGLSLLFHSKRAGGSGLQDIWVTTRPTKSDAWGEPVNLGPTVNSEADDGDACISTDGLALFFFSSRIGGHGHTDLWVTTRKTKKDAWKKPVNLGPKVNSEAQEWFPSISADGSILYFFSNRPNVRGQTDIWQVSIAPGPGPSNPRED
jgi:Tol biopolymer transport system component